MKRIILLLFLLPQLAQAQGSLLPFVEGSFVDSLGVPIASGFVCTTITGTTTNLATYPTLADANAGTNPNTNPVALDSSGRANIFIGTGTYRIVLLNPVGIGSSSCNGTATGSAIKTVNGVAGFGSLLTANIFWPQINNRAYCPPTSATFGAAYTAAVALLPSTGGIVDCSNLQGPQSVLTDVFTGVTKPITLIWPTGVASSSVSLAIPTTTTINLPEGGVLSMAAATTATIAGAILADASTHFAGSGNVLILSGSRTSRVLPQWWGATGDGATNDTAAIGKALTAADSSAPLLEFSTGNYLITPATLAPTTTSLTIAGVGGSFSSTPFAEACATKGPRLTTTATGNVFKIGVAAPSVTGGFSIRDMMLCGGGSRAIGAYPYIANAAINFVGSADQPRITNVNISNFGTAIDAGTAGQAIDHPRFDGLSIISNGFGIVKSSAESLYYGEITNTAIFDNDYPAIFFEDDAGINGPSLIGSTIGRNCRIAGCAALGTPANVVWGAHNGIINANTIQDAGVCSAGSVACGGGSVVLAHGLWIAGSNNAVTNNWIGNGTALGLATYCVVVASGTSNTISGNALKNCGTAGDITVLASASDTIINQPNARVTDAGLRTVVNNFSYNAGDPNSAGQWNGAVKWPGLHIKDTVSGTVYLYHEPPTTRTIITPPVTLGTSLSVPVVTGTCNATLAANSTAAHGYFTLGAGIGAGVNCTIILTWANLGIVPLIGVQCTATDITAAGVNSLARQVLEYQETATYTELRGIAVNASDVVVYTCGAGI